MKSMFKKFWQILRKLRESDFLYIAILTVFAIISLNGTYYYTEMSLGLFCMSGLLSYFICKKFHWSVGILYFYCMSSAIYITSNGVTFYSNDYIEKHILLGVMMLTLHVIPFTFASDNLVKKMSLLIPSISLVSISIIVFKFFTIADKPSGIMFNTSIDPSLLAVCLAIAIYSISDKYKSKNIVFGFLMLFIFSIIVCKGSIGIGAMFISLMIMLFIPHEDNKFNLSVLEIGIGMAIIGFLIKISYLYLGQEFFSDSTRFANYKIFIDLWIKDANYLFGTGFSTFWTIGPYSQVLHNPGMNGDFYSWLHSDWLQIIFELGFIGLALSLNVVYHFLRSCMRNKEYSIGVSGLTFCAVMVFNIPTKFFLFSFIGILILRMGFNKNGCKNI